MPSLKTEVTEIVTGLGTLGYPSLQEAIAARPSILINVSPEHWDRIENAFVEGQFSTEFSRAWENGMALLEYASGLRNRRPLRVEWKGPHKTPGYEFIPVDLRIDHVYLVSCKYESDILFNGSPPHLFERLLASRHTGNHDDWYFTIAPDAYRNFYTMVRDELGAGELPAQLGDLTKANRDYIGNRAKRQWPEPLEDPYRLFCSEVSEASSRAWASQLETPAAMEEMFWRLLRICSAPYFILGYQVLAT